MYSLITTPLFPQKYCNNCQKELTAITQIEYKGLFICPKCYPIVLAGQNFCEVCQIKKWGNEVYIDENRFYCRACLDNIQTFEIDKL